MSDPSLTDSDRLRKSGTVENPADAFGFSEWFARAIGEAYQDEFGAPIDVEVRVDVRPIRAGDRDE